MLSLISFIIVVVGGLNWLCIGMLQYDFVAGMFGSQANIFSRIVYVIVGLMTVYMIFLAIKYKGKVIGGGAGINFAFWKKKKQNKTTSSNNDSNKIDGQDQKSTDNKADGTNLGHTQTSDLPSATTTNTQALNMSKDYSTSSNTDDEIR